MYVCHGCKKELSESEYHKDSTNSTGHCAFCKKCRRENRTILYELLANARKRAKKNGFAINLTKEFLINLNRKQKGLCAISSVKLNWITSKDIKNPRQRVCPWNRVSLDRINPNEGYTMDNVQLVTDMANRVKSYHSVIDLVTFCKAVLNNNPEI